MTKIILKKYLKNKYFFAKSNQTPFRGDIVAFFLTDSYDGNFIKKWLSNTDYIQLGGNMIELEKRNDSIVFSNLYDDVNSKFEFAVSRPTFLKVLDEWEQARSESKEYIVIEVSDDNDVHIYATDKVETN